MVVLTFVSGVVDAASILTLGQVFVANMTGNVVFLGFGLAGAPGFGTLGTVVALAGFALGAVTGGGLIDRSAGRLLALVRDAMAAQAVLLAGCVVLLLTLDLARSRVSVLVVAAIAAVAMGVQSATARRIAVPDMTTSVVTMTLAAIAADHLHGGTGSVLRRTAVLGSLMLGAVAGALLVLAAGGAAAFGLAVLLVAAVSVIAGVGARRQDRVG